MTYIEDVVVQAVTRAWARWPHFISTQGLDGIPLSATANLPLLEDAAFGRVSLQLESAQLTGASQSEIGDVTVSAPTGTFTGTIRWPGLVLRTSALLQSRPLSPVAMATVAGLLRPLGQTAGDDPNLDLARTYRGQLVQSDPGLHLVGMYYDNNATMNEVIEGNAAFRGALARPQSKNLANQTSVAANTPDQPQLTPAYTLQANIMRGYYLRAVLDSQGYQDNDPAYQKLANDLSTFGGHVDASGLGEKPTSVNEVMSYVANSGFSGQPAANAPPRDAEHERMVDEMWAEAKEHARAQTAAVPPAVAATLTVQFAPAAAVVSGVMTVIGSPPNPVVRLRIESIDADVRATRAELSTDGSATGLAAARAITSSSYLQSLLAASAAAALDGPDVRSALQASLNQAITSP